jgi:hypothetical protein
MATRVVVLQRACDGLLETFRGSLPAQVRPLHLVRSRSSEAPTAPTVRCSMRRGVSSQPVVELVRLAV